jgi:hypothetical protein
LIEVKVFDQVYTFDTVHKAEIFITDLIGKYFAEDHIGHADIKVEAKTEDEKPPSVLEVGVVEVVKLRDVGPGQK